MNTIDQILRKKKLVGEIEVEAGGEQIREVNGKYENLIQEFDVINDKCKERTYQAHMKQTSVRGAQRGENKIFGSENLIKGIGHPSLAG